MGLSKYLVVAGISDVADSVTGFAAQPHVSTLMMSLMNQATTPFTAVTSALLLGTRYTALELGAIVGVIGAAAMSVLVAHSNNDNDSTFWAIFAALTTSFAALSFVLKEMVFSEYERASPGAGASV